MHFDIYSFSSLFVCISITAVVSFVFSVKHQMIQIEAALDTIGIRRDEFLELKGKVDLLVEQAKGCD